MDKCLWPQRMQSVLSDACLPFGDFPLAWLMLRDLDLLSLYWPRLFLSREPDVLLLGLCFLSDELLLKLFCLPDELLLKLCSLPEELLLTLSALKVCFLSLDCLWNLSFLESLLSLERPLSFPSFCQLFLYFSLLTDLEFPSLEYCLSLECCLLSDFPKDNLEVANT